VKFNDDGTMDSFAKIRGFPDKDPLFPIQPLQLTAFPDGNFLVLGTTLGGHGLGAFAALFSRGGTFVADVKVLDDVEPLPFREKPGASADNPEQETALADPNVESPEGLRRPKLASRRGSTLDPVMVLSGGKAISAPDGNIYVLRAGDPLRLYVVSPAGLVERELELASPSPGLDPIQVGMAGIGHFFVQLGPVVKGRPDEDLQAVKLISVFDLATGQPTATYRLAPEQSDANLAACAVSPYEFLFVGTSETNPLEVVRYSPLGR
jgi:hypothetical protein